MLEPYDLDPWAQTLALLAALATKEEATSERATTGKRRLLPSAPELNAAAWPQRPWPCSLPPTAITVVERLSDTTVLVSWRDATSCHYLDQAWRLGVARHQGQCALSCQPIQRGEPIYRPRHSAREHPVNAGAMILAAAIDEAFRSGNVQRR
ncbi:DUF3331 domain-containing protein [Burkholderia cenocepacia]|jgi:hypothetical protein|uniref:DUF3331 domain-containing protein n=1 Tax=Burkholderia cenocepacia TaxID=95486 RepID=UPI0009B57AC6|nr:DUF3331 domain-containing protein [Burkholderia cenocepacia]